MEECVRRNQDKDNPRAWCADVMRKTEEHCKGNRMRSGLRTARPRAKLRQGRADWFRITNKKGGDGDTAEVFIYDEIGWFGTTAQGFVDQLREITAGNIDLHLNSPGGDAFDGFAIYQSLMDHPASIHVMVDGLAASAASFIAQAGDRVTMGKAAMLMIHDAFGLAIGNAKDMRDLAERLDKVSNTIAGIYSERAGGPVSFWREAMEAESWYDAREAVAAGLADEVRERQTEHDSEPVEDSFDLSVFTYAGRRHAPAPELPPTTARRTGGPRSAIPQVGSRLADTASPTHHTATAGGSWDKSVHEGRLPSPMSVSVAKRMYGYYDASRVEDDEIVKAACKLPHHEVSTDGSPGAANLAGVSAALGRLSGSDIPESEHGAIRAHLHAHQADGPTEDLAAPWDADLSEALRATIAEHATQAPAVPDPPPPPPEPPEPDPLFDPLVFISAIREAQHAR
jgi:ATP-dependent protease ClpP protease subunit